MDQSQDSGDSVMGHEQRLCFLCWSPRNVEKHHVSYNPERIVYLCRQCHKTVHVFILLNKLANDRFPRLTKREEEILKKASLILEKLEYAAKPPPQL